MSTGKFFIADPYNQEHVNLFYEFEIENNIYTKTSQFLKTMKEKHSQEEYLEQEKLRNEIEQSLFIQDLGKIKDSCHIQGEKDRKACTIFFAPIQITSRNRPILALATDYAFNILGMEEIFIPVKEEDNRLREMLESKGFENLGETNGSLTYIKEKEELKEIGRVI